MSTKTSSVLPEGFSGGPLGLGEPDDRRLRNVEKEILIPQRMRDRARDEKCTQLVEKFGVCCKKQGLLLPFLCQKENKALKACLVEWYNKPEFRKECTEQYLAERSHFRETGVWKKQRKKESATYVR
ncbi:COX assembly mitochondrial protein homolog [Ornithodoros turicata]